MKSKHCRFCNKDHPLTKEYWYSIKTSPQCKLYQKASRRKRMQDPEKRKKVYERNERWRKDNPERWKEIVKQNYKRNKDSIIASNYKYTAKRRKVDKEYDLAIKLRGRFSKAIKKEYKSGSAVKDLGCTTKEFKLYIEAQFQPGMTWNNYGEWHLDHVIPLSYFDLTDRTQVQEACHYLNIQPLWAKDNLKKNNKI